MNIKLFFCCNMFRSVKIRSAANAIVVKLSDSWFAKMIYLAEIGTGVDNCLHMISRVQDLIIIDGRETCARY